MPLNNMLQEKKIASLIGGKLKENSPLPFPDMTTKQEWMELHPIDKFAGEAEKTLWI